MISNAKPSPIIGFMIVEDYDEDFSHWDGVITYPDPTGANLAWEKPTKMIEYSAYEQVKEQCRDLGAHVAKIQSALRHISSMYGRNPGCSYCALIAREALGQDEVNL